MNQHQLFPKWRPMNEAPKDRPIVIRAVVCDWHSGDYQFRNYTVYWGQIDRNHPKHGCAWMLVEDRSSFMPDDKEFHQDTSGLFRGFKKLAWCEVWETKSDPVIVGPTEENQYFGRAVRKIF